MLTSFCIRCHDESFVVVSLTFPLARSIFRQLSKINVKKQTTKNEPFRYVARCARKENYIFCCPQPHKTQNRRPRSRLACTRAAAQANRGCNLRFLRRPVTFSLAFPLTHCSFEGVRCSVEDVIGMVVGLPYPGCAFG